MDKLKEVCENVRKALELSDNAVRPVTMKYFPKGACQTSSLILAVILDEHGFGTSKIVSGMIGDFSHSWVELDGFFIDITQDQFDGGKPVYIDSTLYYQSIFKEVFSCDYRVRLNKGTIKYDTLYPLYLDVKNRMRSNFI